MKIAARIRNDATLRAIETAILESPDANGAEVGRWWGLVAARKYRLAELTGDRNAWRRFGGRIVTR